MISANGVVGLALESTRLGSKCLSAKPEDEISFGVYVGASTEQQQLKVKLTPTRQLVEVFRLPYHNITVRLLLPLEVIVP